MLTFGLIIVIFIFALCVGTSLTDFLKWYVG